MISLRGKNLTPDTQVSFGGQAVTATFESPSSLIVESPPGQAGQTIDIGLMQTNWHWSFDRLSSPWKATEPAYNLKTGCQILKYWYDQHGNWWVAVGKYHRASNAPRHQKAAKRYAARVYKEWEQLQ